MCVKNFKRKVFFIHLKSNNVLPVLLLCLLGRSFGSNIQSMICVGKTGMAGDAKRYKEIHVHISYNMTI